MKFWKKFFDFIKNPPIWLVVLFGFFSVTAFVETVAFALVSMDNNLTLAVLSVFALFGSYFTYSIIHYYKDMKVWIIAKMKQNKYTIEYLNDYKVRSYVSACISFIINTAYSIFQGVLAILSHSVWYGALAIYYFVLSASRGGILINHRRREKNIKDTRQYELSQAKDYRNCGIYLVFIILALSGAIVQMVISKSGYKYAGITIYVVAIYSFYKITVAVINFVKAKKSKDLMLQAIRNLKLADVLVSMLALQTAMFHSFANGQTDTQTFNIITGTCVSVLIFSMSIYMIIDGNKKIKNLKRKG